MWMFQGLPAYSAGAYALVARPSTQEDRGYIGKTDDRQFFAPFLIFGFWLYFSLCLLLRSKAPGHVGIV